MRLHYHIWLIGAACALVVLVASSIISLLGARDFSGANEAQVTPTAALIETMPPGDRAATEIGPIGAVVPTAIGPAAPMRTTATPYSLRVIQPAPDRTTLPAVISP